MVNGTGEPAGQSCTEGWVWYVDPVSPIREVVEAVPVFIGEGELVPRLYGQEGEADRRFSGSCRQSSSASTNRCTAHRSAITGEVLNGEGMTV